MTISCRPPLSLCIPFVDVQSVSKHFATPLHGLRDIGMCKLLAQVRSVRDESQYYWLLTGNEAATSTKTLPPRWHPLCQVCAKEEPSKKVRTYQTKKTGFCGFLYTSEAKFAPTQPKSPTIDSPDQELCTTCLGVTCPKQFHLLGFRVYETYLLYSVPRSEQSVRYWI